MWIFTRHGFFSAVCARQGDGKHGQPVDPDRIMVIQRYVRCWLHDSGDGPIYRQPGVEVEYDF